MNCFCITKNRYYNFFRPIFRFYCLPSKCTSNRINLELVRSRRCCCCCCCVVVVVVVDVQDVKNNLQFVQPCSQFYQRFISKFYRCFLFLLKKSQKLLAFVLLWEKSVHTMLMKLHTVSNFTNIERAVIQKIPFAKNSTSKIFSFERETYITFV